MQLQILYGRVELLTTHCVNMQEYNFSLTRILPYKERIGRLPLHGKMRVEENPYSGIF